MGGMSENTRRALEDVPSAADVGGPVKNFPKRTSGPITAADRALAAEVDRECPPITAGEAPRRLPPE